MTTTERRIHAVADAAARWRDADFPPRVRATRAIRERTGYTEPVVDYALDALFGEFDTAMIEAVIVSELGSVTALEDFVARAGRPDVAYRALPRAAIVASDTTIGVAVPALVFAISAGCDVTVKDRGDRLVTAFVASVAEELPELGTRVATASWDGARDDVASDAHLGDADVVVAYGGDAALAAIRSHLRADARFIAYGHRTSVGYVAREALADPSAARELARGAARDALLYDGDGCLSSHALFVERGATIDVAAFTALVAIACDEIAIEFPAGYDEPDAAVVAYRRAALFRAAQGDGAVFAGTTSPHLVVLDPPLTEPPPLLRRTLAIYAVDGPRDTDAFLARHGVPLEGIALAPSAPLARADVTAFAHASGAARIAPLGALQRPPLGGEHGGHGRILPFVRAIYRA